MMANIKIPQELLAQVIYLLEHIDISSYDPAIRHDYNAVYMAFLKKEQSIELRDAYSKMVFAENEEERTEARLNYLRLKRLRDEF